MIDVRTHRILWTIHKYAGLTACVWLFVLSVTGVLLDHHEWRWQSQVSVPSSWTSERIDRLVPGTVMRYVAATPEAVFGASERGAWRSADKGETWDKITFQGLNHQPQVEGIIGSAGATFSGVLLTTDDGLWGLGPDGLSARRVALAGFHLSGGSPGHAPGEVVVVRDHTDLIKVRIADGAATPIARGDEIRGVGDEVAFNTFIREVHFGRGLLQGRWSIWLNDLGGIAMAVLAFSGLAYWAMKRFGKSIRWPVPVRRKTMRWLYRTHAPILGLLGAIPILYLALTAFPMNHIYGFLDVTKGWTVSRASLPPAYQPTSLNHEIDGVVAWPNQPGRLSITTRFGILESRDNGQSWRLDETVPDADKGGNLFRAENAVFLGRGGNKNLMHPAGEGAWVPIKGPPTAMTSATRRDGQWLFKSSRGFYTAPDGAAAYPSAGIDFKHAAPGTTWFLFMADIHAGVIFHDQFKWLNDLFAACAVLLVLSGPMIWLRRRWV